MNLLKPFTIPEYLFRPRQIFVRLKRSFTRTLPEVGSVRLPWGDFIRVKPNEEIGANLWYYGVFDLTVAEAIRRLIGPGEVALDIGANIGFMTSLMRHCVGPEGAVFAFEPHPILYQELKANCALPQRAPVGKLELHAVALSDRDGDGLLELGAHWESNRGLGRVSLGGTDSREKSVPIRMARMDSFLKPGTRVGVCKIDVEGHELHVFRGADGLLKSGAIRDIIFEDLGSYPSPVHELLLQCGYSLFLLHTTLWKPVLETASASPRCRNPRDYNPNYLATKDPARALGKFKGFGWQALSWIH